MFPLTVFQSLPVDGIVIVTSPQETGIHDRWKGCEDGSEDGYSDPWPGGEHELSGVPGLRQEDLCLW